MSKFKIVWIQAGAIGNRFVTEIEAETVDDALYLFQMQQGYGAMVESIVLVGEEEND